MSGNQLKRIAAAGVFMLGFAASASAADYAPGAGYGYDNGYGYGNGYDNGGRAAGYAFAEQNDISDPYVCEGRNREFYAGCLVYLEERRYAVPAPDGAPSYGAPYGDENYGQAYGPPAYDDDQADDFGAQDYANPAYGDEEPEEQGDGAPPDEVY